MTKASRRGLHGGLTLRAGLPQQLPRRIVKIIDHFSMMSKGKYHITMSAQVSRMPPVLSAVLMCLPVTPSKKKAGRGSAPASVVPLSEIICLRCLYYAQGDAPGSCDAILSDNGESLVPCSRCADAKKSCVPVGQTPSTRASTADNARWRS